MTTKDQDISKVNIAVIDKGELSIYWGVQLPTHGIADEGHLIIDLNALRAFLEKNKHSFKDDSNTPHWYEINSVKNVHH
jgi:hypothetical protein